MAKWTLIALCTLASGFLTWAQLTGPALQGGTPNTPPTISPIQDVTTPVGKPTNPIPFVIGDQETPPQNLTVSATSLNQSLVPNSNILLAGTGQNRTVTISPAAGLTGKADIVIVVADPAGLSAQARFTVTVVAGGGNQPPTISPIPSVVTTVGKPTNPILFTVDDDSTPPQLLDVAAISSNQSLVPNFNLVLTGTGTDRSLVVTPLAGQTGVTTIAVRAVDSTQVVAGASAEGNTALDRPFHIVNSIRYQQAYAASLFSSLAGPTLITRIAFRPVGVPQSGGAFNSVLPDIQINLSTTTASPDALNSTFASNVGTDDTIVFPRGALSLSSSYTGTANGPKDFDIVITLAKPFLYDPGKGNLLLDVRNYGGGQTTLFDGHFATGDGIGAVFSSGPSGPGAGVNDPTGIPDRTGLVTRFTFAGDLAERRFDLFVVANNQPLTILRQPFDQLNVPLGTSTSFEVVATGLGTLRYQWRHNGVLLQGPNQDQSVLPVFDVTPFKAGTYDVTVFDSAGFVLSRIARLTLDLPAGAFSDNFIDAASKPVTNPSGQVKGNNFQATREPNEPLHDFKTGRHSIWMSWQAPNTDGIVHFDTRGSGFDTLLAIYTGTTLPNLVRAASDDDSGGFNTSSVDLRIQPGRLYPIAIDGRLNMSGDIVLSWFFAPGAGEVVPVVLQHPTDQTAILGGTVQLTVGYNTTNAQIDWLFNGNRISGGVSSATAPLNTLTIQNITAAQAGTYQARLTTFGPNQQPLVVLSHPVKVQISTAGTLSQPDVFTEDKYLDLVDPANFSTGPRSLALQSRRFLPQNAPARGYSGTQLFSNIGSTSEPGEPVHCGVPGGVSEWYAIQAESDGMMTIDTIGSSFDTVLAAYIDPANTGTFEGLSSVACNNDINSGVNRQSRVTFPCTLNTIFYCAVDGVSGATGAAVLNYFLNRVPTISDVTDRTVNANTSTPAIAFTIGDAETPAGSLILGKNSSDTTLVPLANIVFGGSGTSRNVTVTPAAGRSGSATITISVTDTNGASASDTFVLTVNPLNTTPTITSISSTVTTRNTPVGPFGFTIGDVETPASNLGLTKHSSNQTVVPDANIVLGGSGISRTVAVTPGTDQLGSAEITITVTDTGGASTNTAFIILVVGGGNSPPVANAQPVAVVKNTPKAITLTGSDPEGQAITYTTVSNPAKGVLSGAPPNVTYTPNANETGADSFTFKVNDGTQDSVPATVSITISDFPPIRISSFQTILGNVFVIEITAQSGFNYLVESSTDLVNWDPFITVSNPTGTTSFSDTTTEVVRCYRVRLSP